MVLTHSFIWWWFIFFELRIYGKKLIVIHSWYGNDCSDDLDVMQKANPKANWIYIQNRNKSYKTICKQTVNVNNIICDAVCSDPLMKLDKTTKPKNTTGELLFIVHIIYIYIKLVFLCTNNRHKAQAQTINEDHTSYWTIYCVVGWRDLTRVGSARPGQAC